MMDLTELQGILRASEIFSNSFLSDLLLFFCFQAVMVRNPDYFLLYIYKASKNIYIYTKELQKELKSGVAKNVLELKWPKQNLLAFIATNYYP